MIVFDLECTNGHTFEGWFADNKAFERQNKKQMVACPVCNVTSVTKKPSSFAIKGSPTLPDKIRQQPDLQSVGRELREYVEKNFDNVGCDFAKEALKIHYGVEEPRNIRGVSTKEEEKTLKEEGIPFFKVPLPASSDSDS
ncbi:MAG: DUF1178 family protein [Deltaproteobacteria bacterium]|nr:DUF1178 family protein [Deltaproteobacteria bacterium]